MTQRLHCGPFEPEAHWRATDLARLPSLGASSTRRVSAMEEMLFAFSRPNDLLLTRRPLHDAHIEYLETLGYAFTSLSVLGRDEPDAGPASGLLREAMGSPKLAERISALPDLELEPFAILPEAFDFARALGVKLPAPGIDTVIRVNAKSYAAKLRERLDLWPIGEIVEDAGALASVGTKMLSDGPILIKDEFGVSGKGNQLVESPAILARLAAYIAKQEAQGRMVSFVIEPLLDKRLDLSCQFWVGPDGGVTIRSVQELRNTGLAFGASFTPSADLMETLHRADYFRAMEQIGKALSAEGYHGEICVDSLVLAGDAVYPLVEINARKSMSLIKHALDSRLAATDRPSALGYADVRRAGGLDFADLLRRLRERGVLFDPVRRTGVAPLTSSLLRPNAEQATDGARMYFIAYHDDAEWLAPLAAETQAAMDDLALADMRAPA